MKAPPIRKLRRPRLERNRVANKSCEMLLVEPSRSFLISLNSNRNAVVTGSRLALGFIGVVVPPHVPTSDHENVTLLQCGTLPFQRLLDL